MSASPLAEFAARWGFAPDSPRLRAALTHTSAAPTIELGNERLEFLGDALLGAFVARFLLEALPPATNEATLTRARVQVIRRETLASVAREIGVSDLLHVGPGERKEKRHTHDGLLADAFEALLAVQYLDNGAGAVETFLTETLQTVLNAVVADPPAPDPKTRLQGRLQAEGKGLPVYHVVEATGIGHDHHFVVEVATEAGQVLGRGDGPNKRTAEAKAARIALESLGEHGF